MCQSVQVLFSTLRSSRTGALSTNELTKAYCRAGSERSLSQQVHLEVDFQCLYLASLK